jgi:hypothetical protein
MFLRRIDGRSYLIESYRDGGRVRHLCLGRADGEMAAVLHHLRQSKINLRAVNAEIEERYRNLFGDVDERLDGLVNDVIRCSEAILHANGYHRPQRWKWYRKRGTRPHAGQDPAIV